MTESVCAAPDNTLRAEQPQQLLDQLRQIIISSSLHDGGPHGMDHSERVLNAALLLGNRLDANLHILAAAALLHDIGRKEESASKGGICHAKRGAELARPILQGLHYKEEDIASICHAIAAHRYRGGIKPLTLEASILFDADKLDSIGAVGIGRAFLFAGKIGARLHNPDLDHGTTKSYSEEDTAYREFVVKLSRVKELMLTPLGRQLAQERHAFMLTFFDQLTREVAGFPATLSPQ